MKCSNCEADIDPKFKFAIKKNQCPICGENIMDAEKLVSFTNLKNLLSANFENIEAEKIATLVVAHFNIEQIFNTSGETKETPKVKEPKIKPKSDKDEDAEYKKKQIEEAKKIIREQAYEEALREQYFGGDESEENTIFDIGESDNPVVMANKQKTEYKQKDAFEKMESGMGAFRRSG